MQSRRALRNGREKLPQGCGYVRRKRAYLRRKGGEGQALSLAYSSIYKVLDNSFRTVKAGSDQFFRKGWNTSCRVEHGVRVKYANFSFEKVSEYRRD